MLKVIYSYVLVFIKLFLRHTDLWVHTELMCQLYVFTNHAKLLLLLSVILIIHFNFSLQWVGPVFSFFLIFCLFVVSKFLYLPQDLGLGLWFWLSLRVRRSSWRPPGLDSPTLQLRLMSSTLRPSSCKTTSMSRRNLGLAELQPPITMSGLQLVSHVKVTLILVVSTQNAPPLCAM